jgi:CheY-like chemotaxis protein
VNKILIVDDESFNLKALRVIFRYIFELNEDSIVLSAKNGKEALEIVERDIKENKMHYSSFGLILMDCNMPIMDGYTATKEIRKLLHSHRFSQPIISAVTG